MPRSQPFSIGEWPDPELNPFDETLPPDEISSISTCYGIQREIKGIMAKTKAPAGKFHHGDGNDGEEPLSFEEIVKKFGVVLEKIGEVADTRCAEVQSAIDGKRATRPRLIGSMRENAKISEAKIKAACKAALNSLEPIDGAPPANFRENILEATSYYLERVIDHRPRMLGITPPLR